MDKYIYNPIKKYLVKGVYLERKYDKRDIFSPSLNNPSIGLYNPWHISACKRPNAS
jgi:hypothetical protein